MTDNPTPSKGRPAIGEAALFGLCPSCGAKTMFAGPIAFAERCRACGFDYSRFNVGDGAAAFVTLGVGALVMALAIWLQLAFDPPWWLQALIWLPLTALLVVLGLRFSKGALLVREYRSGAAEHRHDGSDLS